MQAVLLTLKITKGYYDDFSFDFGWTISGNATSGIWELGEPVGTVNGPDTYNPDFDIAEDFGDQCYVTGNGGGSVATTRSMTVIPFSLLLIWISVIMISL
jgi:hypothetical protein